MAPPKNHNGTHSHTHFKSVGDNGEIFASMAGQVQAVKHHHGTWCTFSLSDPPYRSEKRNKTNGATKKLHWYVLAYPLQVC